MILKRTHTALLFSNTLRIFYSRPRLIRPHQNTNFLYELTVVTN